MRVATFDGNHHSPILKHWGFGFEDLGHDYDFYNIHNSNILSCLDGGYDLIVTVGNIHPKLFEIFKKKNPRCKLLHATDAWYPHYSDFKGLIDAFTITQHSCPQTELQFKTEGFPLVSVPLAADDRTFRRENLEKVYDLNFCGQFSHGYRSEDKFLYPLLDNPKYRCYVGGVIYNNHGNSFTPYQEINKIRNQSLLTLNFHVPYQKEEGVRLDCNQTTFSANLSSSLQIVDHPLALEYYKGKIVMADEKDWFEAIDFYLNDDYVREKAIEEAYQETINNHLFKHRIEKLLKYVF